MKRSKKIFFTQKMIAVLLVQLAFQIASAQKISIRSQVLNAKNEPVKAEVHLCRLKDSLVLQSQVCGSSGFFSFNPVDSGSYFITAAAPGYKDYTTGVIYIPGRQAKPEYDLPGIILENKREKVEQEVTVKGRRLISAGSNKTVINIEASSVNPGSNMLEVIQRLPGVSTDNNGTISLNGRKGVMIMVNGKTINLASADAAKYLSSLPSSSVSQVELLSNPSSRYDAAGTAGIINLKLRYGKKIGFNGTISANTRQGRYNKSGGDISLNFNKRNINIFLNTGILYYRGFSSIPNTRNYFSNTGTPISFFVQTFNSKYKKPASDLSAGISYSFNSKSSLSVALNGAWADEERTAKSSIQSYSYITSKTSLINSEVYTKNEWRKKSISASYIHTIDTSGGEITADLDYAVVQPGSFQLFDIYSYGSNDTLISSDRLQGKLPFVISLYAAKTDFSKKITPKTIINAGLKFAYTKNDNTSRYYTAAGPGVWRADSLSTRQFTYSENINAAYVTFKTKYRNGELEFGGRLENTNYNGELQNLLTASPGQYNTAFKGTYFSFFPFVSFTRNFSDYHSLTVNAGRRIDRPDFYTLNPFTIFVDNYNSFVGNPELKPQLSENINISHTFRTILVTSVYYNRTRNFFSTIYENRGDVIAGKYGNVALVQNTGLSISLQKSVTPWWTPYVFMNTGYFDYRSGKNTPVEIRRTNVRFEVNINNELKLPGKITGECQFGYNSREISLQGFDRSRWWIALGLSKKILKEKYTIRINATDLFYTQYYRGNLFYANAADRYFYKVDSRAAGLSVSRNFGSSAHKKARYNNERATEEKRTGTAVQ